MTIPGLYTHTKTGDKYIVLGIVTDSTNSQHYKRMVLYYSISHGPSDLHVRDEIEFHEPIDGDFTPRFQLERGAESIEHFETERSRKRST